MTEKLTLVLVVGMPGAGKSTLATEVSKVLGWPTIDKDTLKSTLLAAGITNDIAGGAAYELMYAIGWDLLVQQKVSVIFDSPYPYFHKAEALVHEARARLKVVLCLAERDVRNRRVAERPGKLSQPIGVSQTEGDGRHQYTSLPPETCMVQTTQPLAEVLTRVITYLTE